uniref:AIP1m n=1 Tax=Volvox carteri f. nagariensis TaxID=3068 RepID=D9CJ63_VOLCA|nr:AIP1m [Volvox carteri f. nagariensis]
MAAANLEKLAITTAPRVLVAGAPLVGKSQLCQVLTSSEAPRSGSCVPWTIQTKYYTTRVEVCEENVPNVPCTQPEALVLVFNLAEPHTFDLVQSCMRHFDLEAVQLKLLCGTRADVLLSADYSAGNVETSSQPAWFKIVTDWSVQNGVEFIICCPHLPALDATLTLDGDKQGVARVMEALQAHEWPYLKVSSGSKLYASTDGTRNGAVLGLDCVSMDGTASGPQTRQDANELEYGQQKLWQVSRRGLTDNAVGEEMQQHDRGDTESSHAVAMLDGLDLLMEEMKGQKARHAMLSDDERREQAAVLTLRMLEVLGLDSEESCSDDA